MGPPSSGWCAPRWPTPDSAPRTWMRLKVTAPEQHWAIPLRRKRCWRRTGSIAASRYGWDRSSRIWATPRPRPWPAEGKVRRAGVSSFGISGTNAHVIIEAAPPTEAPAPAPSEPPAKPPVVPWVVSAKTASGLSKQAARMAEHLTAHSELDAVDVGWSLAGRSVFEHRAVVLGPDREQLLSGLGELAQDNRGAAVIHGNVRPGG